MSPTSLPCPPILRRGNPSEPLRRAVPEIPSGLPMERHGDDAECEKLREELRQLGERQQDFIRAVTHELRTPMTAISGYAQLLLRDLRKAKVDRAWTSNAEAIVNGTKRMNDLFQDMIDVELLEAGHLLMNLKPVVVKAVVASLGRGAGPGTDMDRVRIELPSDLPPILADTDRLESILRHLITCALHYSYRDVPVTMAAHEANNEVTFSVTGRGEGIDEEGLPCIFDGFMKQKTVPEAGGLGMGLHLTKMLVEAQGGRIWVESKPDKGIAFHFTIPRA